MEITVFGFAGAGWLAQRETVRIVKFSSSPDRGSKLAVLQSLFQARVISLVNNLATMFDIEPLKFV